MFQEDVSVCTDVSSVCVQVHGVLAFVHAFVGASVHPCVHRCMSVCVSAFVYFIQYELCILYVNECVWSNMIYLQHFPERTALFIFLVHTDVVMDVVAWQYCLPWGAKA